MDFAKFGPVEVKPLGRIQKISASRLHASWVNLPHVTQFDEADITALEAERAKLKDKAAAAGVKLTPLAFVVRACVLALKEFPTFNASFDASGENMVLKKYFHIGFAADTPNGLLVPVIRDADKLDVFGIARCAGGSVRSRAQGHAQGRRDAGRHASPSPASAASVARRSRPSSMRRKWRSSASRARRRSPVWDGKAFVPRQMLPLSLSYDHRMIDGAAGARFAVHLSKLLADPAALLAGAV